MSVFDIFESNLNSKIGKPANGRPRATHQLLVQSDEKKFRDFSLWLQLGIKRVFDVIVSLIGLIALSPLFLFVALLIRLEDNGPVFFSQYRWGKDGRKIKVYKFRSMRVRDCDVSGVEQTTENDPRITQLGAFLRRSNIDELPQLLNVLKGEMSIIGPRCHVPGMLAAGKLYEDLVPEYHERHRVRPGLTGLAQVRGLRGPTVKADKARARIAADLFYIEHYSLWLDFKILIGTVVEEFRNGKGF